MAGVEALRTLRAEGVPALLSGPPGTGKTSVVEAAFPGLIMVAGDGDGDGDGDGERPTPESVRTGHLNSVAGGAAQ